MPRKPSCLCGECRKCKHREHMKKWYQRKTPEERREWVLKRDPERVRAYDRERYKAGLKRDNCADQRKRHPRRYKARTAVGNALRDGRLVKGPCEKCGATENVQAHHEDYDKPLEVRWFCKDCHWDEHFPEHPWRNQA